MSFISVDTHSLPQGTELLPESQRRIKICRYKSQPTFAPLLLLVPGETDELLTTVSDAVDSL